MPLNPSAFIAHNGVLQPGDSYTVNITSGNNLTLPDGISGDYYLIVFTDALNNVNEGPFEGDNATNADNTFHVSMANYPDLKVESLGVTVPDASGNVTVTWNTANRGVGAANGPWKDRVVIKNLTTGLTAVDHEYTVNGSLSVNQDSLFPLLPLAGIRIDF